MFLDESFVGDMENNIYIVLMHFRYKKFMLFIIVNYDF